MAKRITSLPTRSGNMGSRQCLHAGSCDLTLPVPRANVRPGMVMALALAIVLTMAASAKAQTFTALYSFTGGADGAIPLSSLIMDGSGNLYGTTTTGGLNHCFFGSGCGVVYQADLQPAPESDRWIGEP